MKALFARTGLRLIESFALADPLYAFDFDGTLAPIVRKPEAAAMSPAVEAALARLAKTSKVIVISGRSVADLRRRVRVPGVELIGNHGIEGFGASKTLLKRASSVSEAWKRKLAPLAKLPGMQIEDKAYSLAVHYRHCPDRVAARKTILAAVETLSPRPRVVPGKAVVNLLPSPGPHKGFAILEAMKSFGKTCAFYIGDDDTDEDVFELDRPGLLTVRVGRKRSSSAQFYVDRQSEIRKVIASLGRNA